MKCSNCKHRKECDKTEKYLDSSEEKVRRMRRNCNGEVK